VPQDINIRVSEEVWQELNRRKQPGDSFDDVLRRTYEFEDEPEASA
jgi:predicted CopG family antitoxin